MPDTMVLLQIDHRNMAMVLAALGQQQEVLAGGGTVDEAILDAVFAYLLGYPDQCHHPKEDAVYRRLRKRDPAAADALDDLVDEHAQLSRRVKEVQLALGRRPGLRSAELTLQLAELRRMYQDHMHREERDFFPAAVRGLTADDWAEVDFEVFDMPDPLFDDEAEARFAALRGEIVRLASAASERQGRLGEAARLAAMVDIAAFNAAMEQHGERLRLSRSASGGYRLQRAGRTLADIPACSESRAAWCAWFFWKAMAQARAVPERGIA